MIRERVRLVVSRARVLRDLARDVGPLTAVDALRGMLSGRPRFSLRVPGQVRPVECRRHTSDIYTLLQVFGRRDSLFGVAAEPVTVLDLGANVGFSSLLYASTYRNVRVLAVEPSSENCAAFVRNCGPDSRIELLQAAVWPRPSWLAIENPADAPDAFRVVEVGEAVPGAVRAVTVADLLARVGGKADIVKMDIEGAERELFAAADTSWLDNVGVLMVEVHDRMRPGCTEALELALAARPHRRSQQGEYVVAVLGSES
jgi:FkbM family methyltransferase